MKKIIIFLSLCFIACVAVCSCQKGDTWDFNYPKEVLCGGTWQGSEYYLDGKWIDITTPAFKDLQFTIKFNTDGTYYGTGYFGNGSGTYDAHGNTIRTYVNGDLFYTYTVQSMEGNVAEITMSGKSGSSLRFKVKK